MIYNGFVFILSGYQDSNLGPPGPKPGALAGLRYTPKNITSIIERLLFLISAGLPTFPSQPARREGDSNPRYSHPYGSLANCWFQPLTHLSVFLGGANVGIIFTWAK